MNALDVLVGLTGFLVTAAVIAGMIFLTPRGEVAVHAEGADAGDSNLSAAPTFVREAPAGVERPAEVKLD